MTKTRERDYSIEIEFKKIFDRKWNIVERTILVNPDYVQWLIDNFYCEFKEPDELNPLWLTFFAEKLNAARALRITMGVERL